MVQSLLAERDLRAGHPHAVRTRLAPRLDRPGADRTLLEDGWQVMPLLVLLAWAHLELGEVTRAAEMVAQAIIRERVSHTRLALVEALWVQAMALTRQERWAAAEHALEEGLALARSMPYPYAEARLLHVYGQMHARKGEPEPARVRLEAALAIFERLGARKDTERVEQAIADLQQP
jgi:tetratricopeptide (TPR) repeat protein